MFTSATILFQDNKSKKNKNLIEQLENVLALAIKRGKLTFNFKIIDKVGAEKAKKYGINKYPAMLLDQKPYNEISQIMAEINNRIKRSTGEVAQKSDDEMLHEFQMGEFENLKRDAAGKIIEEDDQVDNGHQLQQKMQAALQKRADAAREFIGNRGAEQQTARAPQRDDIDFDNHPQRPLQRPSTHQARPNNITNTDDVFSSIARTSSRSNLGDNDKDDLILNAMFSNNVGSD
jgi:hypothetical protein